MINSTLIRKVLQGGVIIRYFSRQGVGRSTKMETEIKENKDYG